MPFPIHFQSTWSKVCILDPQSVGAVVQPLRHVQLFATPWTLAYQASLSFTISLSFLKLLSIESIMPSKHLILCHPPPFSSCLQSFPASGSFPVGSLFTSGGQSIGVSASVSVLPMNIQDLLPLRLNDWISTQSKGLSKSLLQHHSSKASILQHSPFFIVKLSYPYMTTRKTIALTRWNFVGKIMSLLFNTLYRLAIAFIPRIKQLLISWLQSPSSVILEYKKIKSLTVSIAKNIINLILVLTLW